MLVQTPRNTEVVPDAGRRPYLQILVAFDGSPSAWLALERAIDVAERQNGRLTLVAVASPPSAIIGAGPYVVPYTREQLAKEIDVELEQTMAAARDEVPATVPVTTKILHGKPAKVLGAEASSGRYDLLVTGPRACEHGWRGRLRHSVTRALLQSAPISVLAVRRT